MLRPGRKKENNWQRANTNRYIDKEVIEFK